MSESNPAPDPAKMPMDDLIDLVNATEPSIADDPSVDSEDEPEAEPETEDAVETEDAPPEEPVEAEKQEDKPAEAAAEPKADDALPEHVRLRIEASEAERKKFEALAGRHAGELGFLKNKLKEFEQRLSERRSDGEEPSEMQEQTEPQQPKGKDPFAQWAIQQAIAQAVSSFSAKHPDAEALAPEISAYWAASGFSVAALSESPDPMTAAREATEAVELGYLHALAKTKHEAAEKAEKEAARRNADETAKLAGRRRAVAATPTGGVRASVPKREQDPRTMPLSDLKAMIERIGAGTE